MLNLDLSAPKRSCVLLLDPETPGIEKLRWQQLARVMRAQGQDEPRMATHAAEFREVPANLLMSIYHSVAARHGLAVAISCIHQTESEQVLVCTRDVFDQELARLLSGVRRATDQLAKQMAELKAVSSHLEFLSAIN